MKRNISYVLVLLVICCGVFCVGKNVFAWGYPLKEITITGCSGSYCKIDLPIINNAEYDVYKSKTLYRSIYSMQWLSTYYGGWDVGVGSHQGVDIACAIGTPVYASYDGTVIVAGEKGKWGNLVVIQHEWNNKIYYTVYGHLSEVGVNVGDFVVEGMKIGEVGDTGNATGPHLHFQIEINQDGNHPFFPSGCGGTIDEIVNEGNCIQQIKNNTIDPIVFLEQTSKITKDEKLNSENLYLSEKNFSVTGFVGGFLENNSLAAFSLSKNTPGGSLLKFPITMSVDSSYFEVSPSEIQVLMGDRSVFLQSKGKTGLTIVSVKYGDKIVKIFPVFIGSSEDILKWKENKKLLKALSSLGIEV